MAIAWGSFIEQNSPGRMVDFKAIYYSTRCLIHHSDPYKEAEFLSVYQAEGGDFPLDPTLAKLFRRAVPVCINLPTAFLLAAPFSILRMGTSARALDVPDRRKPHACCLLDLDSRGNVVAGRLPLPDLHRACE